ncbi:MAG: aminotransferase class IV [Bacteroidales bacterium]
MTMLSWNGRLLPKDELCLSPSNRAFRYGDGLFETIRVSQGHPLWADRHFARLTRGLHLLQINPGNDWSESLFTNAVKELVSANHSETGNARVRFSAFREEGGLYMPLGNAISWLIESEKLDQEGFGLNNRGIHVKEYTGIRKGINQFSCIKSINAQLYVMASLHKRESGSGDCLILNEEGNIIEATSSNIFTVRDKILFTPPLNQGCVEGIMRQIIIETATENGFQVIEKPLDAGELEKADECFLTNSIQGIRWVGLYHHKRFYNALSRELIPLLNAKAQR